MKSTMAQTTMAHATMVSPLWRRSSLAHSSMARSSTAQFRCGAVSVWRIPVRRCFGIASTTKLVRFPRREVQTDRGNRELYRTRPCFTRTPPSIVLPGLLISYSRMISSNIQHFYIVKSVSRTNDTDS